MSAGRGLLDRSALVELVLTHLETAIAADDDVSPGAVPPVGDHVAPSGGGWANGQPASGIFVPYLVLKTGGGAPRALSPASIDPAWALGFSLMATGGSRTQCDWMARVGYRAVRGLIQQRFGTPSWKIINVEWSSLGPVLRNDATDPPFWTVSDTITLVCDA